MDSASREALSLEAMLPVLRQNVASRDVFTPVRGYQGSVGCPVSGAWPPGFKERVVARQKALLTDREFLGPLIAWLHGCYRSWSVSSLAKAITVKAGEAAILETIRETGETVR